MKKKKPTTFLYKAKAIFSMAVIARAVVKDAESAVDLGDGLKPIQFYNSSGRKTSLVTLVLKLAKLETRNVRSNKSNGVLIWSE